MFTYGSICSGIEAASVAWQGLGKPLWFAEIEPFPSAVLAYRYPEIPNLGDMTALPEKILNREIPVPDVLVGGTPCQAFSIAGKRESLDDERGNLTLALIHILEAIDYVRKQNGQQPCVLAWENVPGVLSTKDNAFGHLLAGLAQECQQLQPPRKRWENAGYVHSARTICWRVLDAQYFGVPQRRKRVFLVASARNRSIAQILFESKGLPRDIETSGDKRESFTATIATSTLASSKPVTGTLQANCATKQWLGNQDAFSGDFFVVNNPVYAFQSSYNNVAVKKNITPPILAAQGTTGNKGVYVCHGTQDPIVSNKTAHCLGRNGGAENVLFEIKGPEAVRIAENPVSPILNARMGTDGNNVPCICWNGDTTPKAAENKALTLRANQGGEGIGVARQGIVRKLTPTECERLQGFPDDWTKIPYRNKPLDDCPDSPRYKAIGNSMAVPVMRWIGERLVDYLKQP